MVGRCDPPAVTTDHSAKAIKEQRIVNKETSSSNRVIDQDTKMAEVRVLCLNAKENSLSTLYRLKQGECSR